MHLAPRILVLGLAAICSMPPSVLGTTWQPVGADANADVYSVASDGARVYAGGIFTAIGGASAQRIAKWTGTAWQPLGGGIGTAGDSVNALAVGPDGTVFAGGQFSTAGGAGASNIAAWDGTAWRALGPGLNNAVYTLATDSAGNLYAGGVFSGTGDGLTQLERIAKWDGATWSALGVGVAFPGSLLAPSVQALAVDSAGDVIAGGTFTVAGGISAMFVARWNGSTWASLGAGRSGSVAALSIATDGAVYAGEYGEGLVRWDGTSWATMGGGLPTPGQALAVSPNAVLADTSGGAYVGGDFVEAGGAPAGQFVHWTGTTWALPGPWLGTSNQGAYGVSSLARDRAGYLYAGGRMVSSDNTVTHMARLLVAQVPGAPTNAAATAGTGQATVTWAAPASDGGGAITAYTVTSAPAGGTCTAAAPDTSCTVTGLPGGGTYTFTVTATNAAGTGASSAPSRAVTLVPPGEPGAPVPGTASASPPALPESSQGLPAAPRRLAGRFVLNRRTRVGTTTGTLPAGATRVVQAARTGSATATQGFLEMATVKRATGRCRITPVRNKKTRRVVRRNYRCTIKLAKGTWTVTTTARGTAGVVAQGTRRVRVR